MRNSDEKMGKSSTPSNLVNYSHFGAGIFSAPFSLLAALFLSVSLIFISQPALAQWTWFSNLSPFSKKDQASEKSKTVAVKKKANKSQATVSELPSLNAIYPPLGQDSVSENALPNENLASVKLSAPEGYVKVAMLDPDFPLVVAQQPISPSDTSLIDKSKREDTATTIIDMPPRAVDAPLRFPVTTKTVQNESILELPHKILLSQCLLAPMSGLHKKTQKNPMWMMLNY